MKALKLDRYLLGFLVTMLGACDASQPLNILAPAPSTVTAGTFTGNRGSWVAPEAASDDLLYVSDASSAQATHAHVLIFTYPQGRLVGQLKGFSNPIYGLCVGAQGNVFVTDSFGEDVREYAHGSATPILTLHVHGEPEGCAVDPTSGDIAVAMFCDGPNGSCYSEGTILVYKRTGGQPKKLTDSDIATPSYCSYDKSGNLFVVGLASVFYTDTYDELRRGSSEFIGLSIPGLPKAQQPGSILWKDGDLLIAPEAGSPAIYRYQINGTNGTKIGVTKLGGVPQRNGVFGFWVQDKTLVAPEYNIVPQHGIGQVQYFGYPAGGKPEATIGHVFYFPTNAVVSLAPK